jgi:hypothetical protein
LYGYGGLGRRRERDGLLGAFGWMVELRRVSKALLLLSLSLSISVYFLVIVEGNIKSFNAIY